MPTALDDGGTVETRWPPHAVGKRWASGGICSVQDDLSSVEQDEQCRAAYEGAGRDMDQWRAVEKILGKRLDGFLARADAPLEWRILCSDTTRRYYVSPENVNHSPWRKPRSPDS
jgi:hypothetical protein